MASVDDVVCPVRSPVYTGHANRPWVPQPHEYRELRLMSASGAVFFYCVYCLKEVPRPVGGKGLADG